MVRINLILPSKLSDQHLVAEYYEILMLISYILRFPSLDGTETLKYCLGKGHMKFFRNKVMYLKKRHELLKLEMKKRGFIAGKNINLSLFSSSNKKDWKPCSSDFKIIKKRILKRLKEKPNYYRYYGEYKGFNFFKNLLS